MKDYQTPPDLEAEPLLIGYDWLVHLSAGELMCVARFIFLLDAKARPALDRVHDEDSTTTAATVNVWSVEQLSIFTRWKKSSFFYVKLQQLSLIVNTNNIILLIII